MTTEVILLDQLPDYIRARIESGDPGKMRCPRCDGGRSNELSLSVFGVGVGVVRLKCWRATCGWYATTMTDPSAKMSRKTVRQAMVYRESIGPVGGTHIADVLVTKYGLDLSIVFDHSWGITNDTLVMPVLDPYGGVRGHVTRTFDKSKRCMTYKATAQPWLDWWPGDAEHKPLVIVEDTFSACRLAGLGYPSVALLGTGISVEQAQEIAEVSGTLLMFLALDRDAFTKAIQHAIRHAHIVIMRPVCLTEDVKNIKEDRDIHKLFKT